MTNFYLYVLEFVPWSLRSNRFSDGIVRP